MRFYSRYNFKEKCFLIFNDFWFSWTFVIFPPSYKFKLSQFFSKLQNFIHAIQILLLLKIQMNTFLYYKNIKTNVMFAMWKYSCVKFPKYHKIRVSLVDNLKMIELIMIELLFTFIFFSWLLLFFTQLFWMYRDHMPYFQSTQYRLPAAY